MNYVISIINPHGLKMLSSIYEALDLPLTISLIGRGTATQKTLDLLGIEQQDKRVVLTVASQEKTEEIIKEHKRRLYIDAPGNGILISVPVKSIGGGKTLAFLSGGQPQKNIPELNFNYELVMVIANEGYSDMVMDAARAAGATGGTVLHGKGTGSKNAAKFFKVSIAQEKDLILIVAKSEEKAAIMSSIVENAGTSTDAGAIAFSLPVNNIAGFSMGND